MIKERIVYFWKVSLSWFCSSYYSMAFYCKRVNLLLPYLAVEDAVMWTGHVCSALGRVCFQVDGKRKALSWRRKLPVWLVARALV